jgi:hypothetical protein
MAQTKNEPEHSFKIMKEEFGAIIDVRRIARSPIKINSLIV